MTTDPTGHATPEPATIIVRGVSMSAANAATELDRMQTIIETLRAQRNTAEDQRDLARSANNQLLVENARLRQALADSRGTVAQYIRLVDERTEALSRVEAERAAATEARQQLAGEVQRQAERLDASAHGCDVAMEINKSGVAAVFRARATDLRRALAATAPPAAPSEPPAPDQGMVREAGSEAQEDAEDPLRDGGAIQDVAMHVSIDLVQALLDIADQDVRALAASMVRIGHDLGESKGRLQQSLEHMRRRTGGDEPPAGDWVSAEVYWVTTESLRAERDKLRAALDSEMATVAKVLVVLGMDGEPDADDETLVNRIEQLSDLRRDVVMALCVEDDDEERTDAEIVQRVRELVAAERAS